MINKDMALTATNIKYIIAIYNLGGKDRFVKCTDIARTLSVTRPSVHAMVKTLIDMQLINKPRYGKVNFTSQGKEMAEKYMNFYVAMQKYLKDIFFDNMDVFSAVCAFMSEIPYNRIDEMCSKIYETQKMAV